MPAMLVMPQSLKCRGRSGNVNCYQGLQKYIQIDFFFI